MEWDGFTVLVSIGVKQFNTQPVYSYAYVGICNILFVVPFNLQLIKKVVLIVAFQTCRDVSCPWSNYF